jgi:hypothetical protein
VTDCFIKFLVKLQGDAQIVVRLGGIGLEPDRLAQMLDCLGAPTQSVQGEAEVDVGIRIFGARLKGRAKVGFSIGRPAQRGEFRPKIVVRFGRARVDFNRLAVLCDCFVRFALPGEGEAEVGVRLAIELKPSLAEPQVTHRFLKLALRQ